MAPNSNKFIKLRRKVERKLIGEYNSNIGLGQNMIVKKYKVETNNYGDPVNTLKSTTTTKGIIVNSKDFENANILELTTTPGELRVYVPVSLDVKDTDTYTYEFTISDQVYVLTSANVIGKVCNTIGVVQEIVIKPKV